MPDIKLALAIVYPELSDIPSEGCERGRIPEWMVGSEPMPIINAPGQLAPPPE